ncbi:MAG: hypothetical protein L6R35_001954 [Caloplaca aegaea]|nr:MAG: hypothetical protein L6R35_001954 [Caloplaca aegaea]
MAQSMSMSHRPGPNALDDSNRGPALLAGSITLITAATFAVTLRLVARRIKKVSWAADDHLAIVALAFAYAMFTSMIFCIKHGLGIKRPTNITAALETSKWLYISEALFPVTTIATKLSILYLYKRIFSTFNRTFAWALYIIGALQAGWAVSGFFTTVFQCWPIDILWRLDGGLYSGHPAAGHCIDLIAMLTGLAVINTLLNTALLVLPMPMIWNLHTSRKNKMALTLIFALACADISASIARTYLTSRAITDPSTFLWEQAPAVILSFAEPCVGIICACLPVMRPLLGLASTTLFNIPLGSSSWMRSKQARGG